MFWVAALVISAALLWLLSRVLLPFVAGMALAYLLDPVTRRVERTDWAGFGRALIVIALIIVTIVVAVILVAPILGAQLSPSSTTFQSTWTGCSRCCRVRAGQWLGKFFGSQIGRYRASRSAR